MLTSSSSNKTSLQGNAKIRYEYSIILTNLLTKLKDMNIVFVEPLLNDKNSHYDLSLNQMHHIIINILVNYDNNLDMARNIIDHIGKVIEDNNIDINKNNQNLNIKTDEYYANLCYIFPSLRDSIYIYYKRLFNIHNYSPLTRLLILGTTNQVELYKSLKICYIFSICQRRLYNDIWGNHINIKPEYILNIEDKSTKLLYIALVKELDKLSIKETESILCGLFNVKLSTPESNELQLEYANMIRSISKEHSLLSKSSSQQITIYDTLDQYNDEDLEKNLQGPFKKIDHGNNKNTELISNHEQINQLDDSIILSEDFLNNAHEILNTLTHSFMIIINGKSGIGKSYLIKYISQIKQKQHDLITLFMDNTTDFKTLLGNYTCSENIGEFEWKNGPLITAMMNGKWLLLENFQEANDEMGSSLISLIKKGEIFIPNTGKVIKPAVGFKIIAISDYDKEFSTKNEADLNKLYSVFDSIPIVNLNTLDIISYLKSLLEKKFEKDYIHHEDNKQILLKLLNIIDIIDNHNKDCENLTMRKIKISTKSFVNLLIRFIYQLKIFYGDEGLKQNNYFTENFRLILLIEVIDTIFQKYKDFNQYDDLFKKICEIFGINFEIVATFLQNYNPKIEFGNTKIHIGRLGDIDRNFFDKKNITNIDEENFNHTNSISKGALSTKSNIVYNSYTTRLIEKIACCMYHNESCLLVGDTGCGKTTIAQHVAEMFNKKLHVYNLSQGSDAVDLIGGFKPIEVKMIIKNILRKYIKNLLKIVNEKANEKFLESIKTLYTKKNYNMLLKCMIESMKMIREKINKSWPDTNNENRIKMENKWKKIEQRLINIYNHRDKIETNLAFQFIEGNLIKAMKNGDWILIDEINLANNEVLQKLLPIIEGTSLLLYEKGDIKEIKRDQSFKLIGCMNPGTDIGKRELPANVRIKFTEFFIEDLQDKNDIAIIVEKTLGSILDRQQIDNIVELYIWLKFSSDKYELEDGYNKRPHFSLRNLSRALNYIKKTANQYGKSRSILEGIFTGFASKLSIKSQKLLEIQIEKYFNISNKDYHLQLQQYNKVIDNHINIYGFSVKKGPLSLKRPDQTDFEITKNFERYLIELLRIISNTDHPILLEGPTSSGKTSIIKYICDITGYKCVRVNNHHHTDIEEYIGTYMPDSKGKLVFKEGILVEALRNGYWIILDELNLAKSEILESLNRLLDDNKELFIPEMQIHIKPHENFRLFATQNPVHYSGRKELSKAFTNRFIQIYFDEISEQDLEKIILKKCQIAPSYCKKLLGVMKELQLLRQRNNFFMGKEAAITVRDLIKWAKRPHKTIEELAIEGYMVLAERLRSEDEKIEVKKIIEKNFKCKLEPEKYYWIFTEEKNFIESRHQLDMYLQEKGQDKSGIKTIEWNMSFRRMSTLVKKCLENKEPVLLIGETGCGKTTMCQLMAILYDIQFFSINCHQYTESMDFLGSLKPLRNREEIENNLKESNVRINNLIKDIPEFKDILVYLNDETKKTDDKISFLTKQIENLEKIKNDSQSNNILKKELQTYLNTFIKSESLFEWQDGPLTQAIKQGGIFLIDEISLADDSVLERLNSVLESERTLTLSEKTDKIESIIANDKFFILATMNPGGDFGKRELSPALRNRFTEIWVEPITAKHFLNVGYNDLIEDIITSKEPNYKQMLFKSKNDFLKMLFDNLIKNEKLHMIIQLNEALYDNHMEVENQENIEKIEEEIKAELAICIYRFVHYFNVIFCEKYLNEKKALSLRDILTILNFFDKCDQLSVQNAFKHALNLVILDSVGMLFSTGERLNIQKELDDQLNMILTQNSKYLSKSTTKFKIMNKGDLELDLSQYYIIGDFGIPIKPSKTNKHASNKSFKRFSTSSKKVQENLIKLVRATQLDKAIMLEGSPGVGKTSLIEFLAYMTGNKLLRINLSEQTDLMDLLGCDVPKGNQNHQINKKMEFAWADGLLLKAMKKGHWIILDELNLANQTVLEGLNAILDHRGAVFIPELNKQFIKHPSFRIFASQNPVQQGGGRKGLPSSFLNRFIKVYIEDFDLDDYNKLICSLYSTIIPTTTLNNLIIFNDKIRNLCIQNFMGEKWEFNLRDLLRVCDLIEAGNTTEYSIDMIYFSRIEDPEFLFDFIKIYETIFQVKYSFYTKAILPSIIESTSESKLIIMNNIKNQEYTNITINDGPQHMNNYTNDLKIFNKDLCYIDQLIKLINLKWPILITGQKSIGKSMLIRLIAKLTNNKLVEIRLNSSTDSSELIGNYDQDDISRQYSEFVTEFIVYLRCEIIHNILICQKAHVIKQQLELFNYLKEIITKLELTLSNIGNVNHKQTNQYMVNCIDYLENYKEVLIDYKAYYHDKNQSFLSILKRFQVLFDESKQNNQGFRWFNSELIQAVQNGYWILLENVGGCNSAVLERLNPLLESNGYLYINECGSINGKSVKVIPHPNFRLFMVLNPDQEKLSRSFRNRCVELCIRSPSVKALQLAKYDDNSQQKQQPNLNDVLKYDMNNSQNQNIENLIPNIDSNYSIIFMEEFLISLYEGDLRKIITNEHLLSQINNDFGLIDMLIMLNSTYYEALSKKTAMQGNLRLEYGPFLHMINLLKQNIGQGLSIKPALKKAFTHAYYPIAMRYHLRHEDINLEKLCEDILNNYIPNDQDGSIINKDSGIAVYSSIKPLCDSITTILLKEEGLMTIIRDLIINHDIPIIEKFRKYIQLPSEDIFKVKLVWFNMYTLNAIINQQKYHQNSLINIGLLFKKILDYSNYSDYQGNNMIKPILLIKEVLFERIQKRAGTILNKLNINHLLEYWNICNEVFESIDNVTNLSLKQQYLLTILISIGFTIIYIIDQHSSLYSIGNILSKYVIITQKYADKLLKHHKSIDKTESSLALRINKSKIIHKLSGLARLLLPKNHELLSYIKIIYYMFSLEYESHRVNIPLSILTNKLIESKNKFDEIIGLDESTTNNMYNIFSILCHNIISLSSNKIIQYKMILNDTINNIQDDINNAHIALNNKYKDMYVNINEEYQQNTLIKIPIIRDQFSINNIIKYHSNISPSSSSSATISTTLSSSLSSSSIIGLMHLALYISTLKNIIEIMYYEFINVKKNNKNSIKIKDILQKIVNDTNIPFNTIYDHMYISGEFRLFWYYLYNKNTINPEELMELSLKLNIETLNVERKFSEHNLAIKDLISYIINYQNHFTLGSTLIGIHIMNILNYDVKIYLKSSSRKAKISPLSKFWFWYIWIHQKFSPNLTLDLSIIQDQFQNIMFYLEEVYNKINIMLMNINTNEKLDHIIPLNFLLELNKELIEILKNNDIGINLQVICKRLESKLAQFIWKIYFIFDQSPENVSFLYNSNIKIALYDKAIDYQKERSAGYWIYQLSEYCAFNLHDTENNGILNILNKLHKKLILKQEKSFIRTHDPNIQIDVIDDFLKRNCAYTDLISKIKFDEGFNNVEDYNSMLNISKNWIQISYSQYYQGFKDILLPLQSALIIMINNSNTIEKSSNTSKIEHEKVSILMNELISNLQDKNKILELMNIEIDHDITTRKAGMKSIIKLNEWFMILGNMIEENNEDKQNTDDRATKIIKLQRKLMKEIVDEYTPEAADIHAKEEEKELEDRFLTKESKEQMETFMKYDTIKDLIRTIQEKADDMENLKVKKEIFTPEKIILSLVDSANVNDKIRLDKEDIYKYMNSKIKFQTMFLSYNTQQLTNFMAINEIIPLYDTFETSQIVDNYLKILLETNDQSLNQNFYQHENPIELNHLYYPFVNCLIRVNNLLQDENFSCNPLLQNIALLIDHIQKQYLKHTPLVKSLPFLSHLLQKIEEWNALVPMIYKIIKEYEDIRTIVLKWRKLERQSWKNIMQESEKKVLENDAKLIPLMIKSISISQENKTDEIYNIIEEYIRKSSVGTFGLRMKALRYVMSNIQEFQLMDKVKSILSYIINFYEQFEEAYKARLKAANEDLEKDIGQYILLTKWDSHDYLSLRYTVEKYHKKINRILKRYEEFLDIPIEMAIFQKQREIYVQESINHFLLMNSNEIKSNHSKINNINNNNANKSNIDIKDIISTDGFTEYYTRNLKLNTINSFDQNLDTIRMNKILSHIIYQFILILPIKYPQLILISNDYNHYQNGLNNIHENYNDDLSNKRKNNKGKQGKKSSINIDNVNSNDKLINQDELLNENLNILCLGDYLQINIWSFSERMNRLKDEKGAKSLKIKAVIDVYKLCRSIGFNDSIIHDHKENLETTIDFDSLQKYLYNLDISSSLTPLSTSSKNTLMSRLSKKHEKICKYQCKAQDYLNILNSNKQFNQDLSLENLKRGHGLISNMLDYGASLIKNFNKVLRIMLCINTNYKIVNYLNKPNRSSTKFIKLDNSFHTILTDISSKIKNIRFGIMSLRIIIEDDKQKHEINQVLISYLVQLEQSSLVIVDMISKLLIQPMINHEDLMTLNIKLNDDIKSIIISVLNELKSEERNDQYYDIILTHQLKGNLDDITELSSKLRCYINNKGIGLITSDSSTIINNNLLIEEEYDKVDIFNMITNDIKGLLIVIQNHQKSYTRYKTILNHMVYEDENENDQLLNNGNTTSNNDTNIDIDESLNSMNKTKENKPNDKCKDLKTNELLYMNKFIQFITLYNDNHDLNKTLLNYKHIEFNLTDNIKDLFKDYESLLQQIQIIFRIQIIAWIRSIKKILKFIYLISSAIYNITYKGFCIPPEELEKQNGDNEEEGQVELGEGIGIGEGEGRDNISKEIEFEEQVLGERKQEEYESKKDKKEKGKDIQEEKDGIDMQNDFEGDNFDMEKNEDNEEEEKKSKEDEENMDDEFSSVEDQLDYKLWHDDENEKGEGLDEEEEEEEGQEDEKKDENKLGEEEKLEFHDKEKKKNTEQRAKEENQPEKDKQDKRNISDYDEFAQEDYENEEEEEDLDESKENEEKEDDANKKNEHNTKELDYDKERISEENSLQQDDELPQGKDEEIDFESEGEEEGSEHIHEDDQKNNEKEEANEDHDNNEENKIDEEELNKSQLDELNQDKHDNEDSKDLNEEKEEEQEKQQDKEYKSSHKVKEDNKIQSIQNKNQQNLPSNTKVVSENKLDENQQNQENQQKDQINPDNNQNQGSNDIDPKQTNQQEAKFEELLRKLLQNNNITKAEELINFIKDLNISGNDEKNQNLYPENQDIIQANEDKRNLDYEIIDPNNNQNTDNLTSTNAPSKNIGPTTLPAQNKINNSSENPNENTKENLIMEEEKAEEQKNQPMVDVEEEDKKNDINKKSTKNEKNPQMKQSQEDREKSVIEKHEKNILNELKSSEKSSKPENMQIEEKIENKQKLPESKRNKDKTSNTNNSIIKIDYLQSLSHQEMKQNLLKLVQDWRSDITSYENAIKVWNQFEANSRNQAMHLCEELKAVLEPTLISSLKGDFKSGKRLNMKKIIPYIASNYRKDKIWLRRADPSKRQYQIMIAIDDSLSMSHQDVGFLALESLTMLALAMSKLEVGQISICKIADIMTLLHPFDIPLRSTDGPYILSQFKFEYQDMNSSDLSMGKFMRSAIDLFKEWKLKEKAAEQICFIISDGRLNKNIIRPLMREAEENGQLYIFVILDSKEDKESIMNIKSTHTSYENGKLNIKITNYMEDFPFKYYLIVKDLISLPKYLVDILRQYFEKTIGQSIIQYQIQSIA